MRRTWRYTGNVNDKMMSTRVTCAAVTSATPSCSVRAVIDISAIPPGAAASIMLGTKMPVATAKPHAMAAENSIIKNMQSSTAATKRGAPRKN